MSDCLLCPMPMNSELLLQDIRTGTFTVSAYDLNNGGKTMSIDVIGYKSYSISIEKSSVSGTSNAASGSIQYLSIELEKMNEIDLSNTSLAPSSAGIPVTMTLPSGEYSANISGNTLKLVCSASTNTGRSVVIFNSSLRINYSLILQR